VEQVEAFNNNFLKEVSNMDQVRRYHLRSLDTYDNDTDLLQSYKKYLNRNDLMEAYWDNFEDAEINKEIRKVLQFNCDHDNLIIKDKNVEKWARNNDVEMVNEYEL
jgi:hypothetical protein